MASETPSVGRADFVAAHGSLLNWLYAQSGAARWNVSRADFSATLHACAVHRFGSSCEGAELEAYLRGLHLNDLALACALSNGAENAWEEFVSTYRPLLYSAARAIVGSAGEAAARELADSLYAELYGMDRPGTGRRPLLGYFHGRSKLATWLRAVLAQKHVDTLRASRHLQPLESSSERVESSAISLAEILPSNLSNGGPDRERLVPHLREAVAESFAALAPADRLLLSLYYVQDLSLAQIAGLRGVHEATISRQIERLRRGLRQSIEGALLSGRGPTDGRPGRRALSTAEVELCFSYGLEDWAFDLSAVLSPGKQSPEGGEA